MVLNPDCIRDILLLLEAKIEYGRALYINWRNYKNYCDKYSKDEFFYHLEQCIKFQYVDGEYKTYSFKIYDLTPKGHSFLANIRSITTWNKTKNIASKIGSLSLEILKDIASDIITKTLLEQHHRL